MGVCQGACSAAAGLPERLCSLAPCCVPDDVRTRALSRAKPARPYIALLIVLSRFTCPSVDPELKGRVNAARTAAQSWRRNPGETAHRRGPVAFRQAHPLGKLGPAPVLHQVVEDAG